MRWKKTACVWACLTLSASTLAQAGWRVLHDPFSTIKQPVATPLEQQWLNKAKRQTGWLDVDNVLLQARIPGPFLRTGANETALLYGDGQERIALLILRAGNPVLHVQLLNNVGISAVKEAYAVRDLNGDGLRELAVVQHFGDAGFYGTWLNLLDFRTGTPQIIQRFKTQERNCEPGTSAGKQRAYRLDVLPGMNPTYRATEYGRDDCAGQKLRLLRRPVTPPKADFPELTYAPQRLPLP